MKITRIETIGLKASLKETWIASGFTIKETTSTIVRISTDARITGYGECLARFTTKITQTIVESLLKPILLGRDPFDVEILWEEMFATMRTKGHSKGFMIEAMSGVDMALWDVMGKAAGLPICKLLGGKARDRVEAYASALLFKDLDTLRAEAAELAGKGYRAIKMKVGKGLEEDLRSIEAVRSEIGPGVKLMLDANSGFDSFSALSLLKHSESQNIYWLEEPVPPDDLDGYGKVSAASSVPIAAGESEFTRFGFRDLIIRGGIAVVQPDPARSGGISECRKIAALAASHNRKISPHTGASGALCVAAALQLAAAFPHFTMYEDMIIENPLRDNILRESLPALKEGKIAVPDEPGLGVNIDEEKFEQYIE